ncbi:MAG TPA: FHA domain-containing protein [Gammaproteobacteria bacterium]|nr:FHA domain-containing protein [Gammaproteobacteria bacterium]
MTKPADEYQRLLALIEDQKQRLKSLGAGREESMRALVDLRDELKRVSRERDELRKQLARLDRMQTETIALPEDFRFPSAGSVPSLDELMSELGDIEEPGSGRVEGHLHQRVESAAQSEEMISPEVVFPEKFAATAESAEQKAPVSRVLVLLDAERPIKYPLFKETMTIGRAESADIQINNDFLSRLHARIVSTPDGAAIEDIESKNGIRVNTKLVTKRQGLRHGDIVDLGRLRFRYIDAAYDAD